jgi:hypothetical protein
MSLVNALSRLLEPAEREAVLGDFAESGETGVRAVCDLSGLVIRRQAALWRDWNPWLAAAAVALPAGLMLSVASGWLASGYGLYSWIAWNYKDIDPATLAESGLSLHAGFVQVARASLVLLAWTWASGFVLGALSRRAIWLNGLLFCAALLRGAFYWALREHAVELSTCAMLAAVMSSVFLGVRLGRRPAVHPAIRTMLWIAALVTALAVRSSFWWPGWTGWRAGLMLAAYAPAVYLIGASVPARISRDRKGAVL